jgi:hypothetical protein
MARFRFDESTNARIVLASPPLPEPATDLVNAISEPVLSVPANNQPARP